MKTAWFRGVLAILVALPLLFSLGCTALLEFDSMGPPPPDDFRWYHDPMDPFDIYGPVIFSYPPGAHPPGPEARPHHAPAPEPKPVVHQPPSKPHEPQHDVRTPPEKTPPTQPINHKPQVERKSPADRKPMIDRQPQTDSKQKPQGKSKPQEQPSQPQQGQQGQQGQQRPPPSGGQPSQPPPNR